MKKTPITRLIIDTSSTNENDNGECDFCLVGMTAEYVSYLLEYMHEVDRLHRADDSVYAVECWDASPSFFQDNDKLQSIRDIDGELAADIPRGEPILLTVDPQFTEDDLQRVDCQTVQVSRDEVWWTAYVKHTNIRIESAHVQKKTLRQIQRSLGGAQASRRPARAGPVHPAVQRIHDLLYLDVKGGRQFYNPDKCWDADTLTIVAEIVARYIPRPRPVGSDAGGDRR